MKPLVYKDLDLAGAVPDDEVIRAIRCVPEHRSASLAVDIGNTCHLSVSLPNGGVGGTSGSLFGGNSGVFIGSPVDLLHADTYCNVWASVIPLVASSGAAILQVQCSDSDVSGNYTDPTSGLAALPGSWASGGLLWLNSGSVGGLLNSNTTSGSYFLSGTMVAQAFQRTGRYARLNWMGSLAATSGFFGSINAGFISNLRTVGSGGGQTQSPGSGTPSV